MLKISFDCVVDTETTTSRIEHECYFVTLPIAHDECSDETDDFPTANELTLAKYSLIKCRFCENTLYSHCSAALQRVRPLPPEYWLELSDMWFCCPLHQMDFNAQELRAKADALLMGKVHIILHERNLRAHAIALTPRTVADEYSVAALCENEQLRIDRKHEHAHCATRHAQHEEEHKHEDEQKTSWDGVQAFNCVCARCETLLGISYKTVTESEEERLNEFHLWKFELATEGAFSVPFSRNGCPST